MHTYVDKAIVNFTFLVNGDSGLVSYDSATLNMCMSDFWDNRNSFI